MRQILKHSFIPNAENEYQPHGLRTAAVVGMTLLILLTFAVANIQSIVWTTSEWMVSTILPAVIVTETNDERALRERAPLRRSEVLDRAATMKAEHMAANGYFAHFSPDGTSPWHWFDEAGYEFVHAGENLAVYFTDSSEIVDAWMDSPLHRANILDQNYREIGIGVAEGEYEGYETIYVVQLFGTPAQPTFTNFEAVDDIVNRVGEALADVGAEPLVAGVTDTVSSGDTVVLYSEHVSTSTGGTAAAVEGDAAATEPPPSIYAVLTQPSTIIQMMYLSVALFVLIALVFSVVASMRRRRPLQIAYGVGLLALMAVLFHVHIAVSAGVLIA